MMMLDATAGDSRSDPLRTVGEGSARHGPVRARLRAETAALHRQTEDRLALDAIGNLARYREVMGAFGALYAALSPSNPALGGVVPPGDLARLHSDLDDLGLGRPGPVVAVEPASPAEHFGIRYVIEGSRLGARIIARRIKAQLGVDRHWGGAFFDVDAKTTAERWRRFCAELEEGCASPAQVEQAVTGANRTFALFLAAVLPAAGRADAA